LRAQHPCCTHAATDGFGVLFFKSLLALPCALALTGIKAQAGAGPTGALALAQALEGARFLGPGTAMPSAPCNVKPREAQPN
jgi:hypothetical protein